MVAGLLRNTEPWDKLDPPEVDLLKRFFVNRWAKKYPTPQNLVVMHMMVPKNAAGTYMCMTLDLFKGASLPCSPYPQTLERTDSLRDMLSAKAVPNTHLYFIQTFSEDEKPAPKFTDRAIMYNMCVPTAPARRRLGYPFSDAAVRNEWVWRPLGYGQHDRVGCPSVDDVTNRDLLLAIPVNNCREEPRSADAECCPLCYDTKPLNKLPCDHLVCQDCMFHSSYFDKVRCGKCYQEAEAKAYAYATVEVDY